MYIDKCIIIHSIHRIRILELSLCCELRSVLYFYTNKKVMVKNGSVIKTNIIKYTTLKMRESR